MRAVCLWRSGFVFLLGISCFMCCQAPVQAADKNSPAVPAAVSATPQSTPDPELRKPAGSVKAAEEEAPMRQLKFNLDFYAGVSNLPGQRRFRDGFWAGYGLGYP